MNVLEKRLKFYKDLLTKEIKISNLKKSYEEQVVKIENILTLLKEGKLTPAKSHWLIAKDKEDATRIASTELGTPENLQELSPTENIDKLLKEGKTGLLLKQISGMIASDFFSGKKIEQPKEPWFIYKKV